MEKLHPTTIHALHEAAVRNHCACLGVSVDEWRYGRSAWHADIDNIIQDERITMLIAHTIRKKNHALHDFGARGVNSFEGAAHLGEKNRD